MFLGWVVRYVSGGKIFTLKLDLRKMVDSYLMRNETRQRLLLLNYLSRHMYAVRSFKSEVILLIKHNMCTFLKRGVKLAARNDR